MAEPVSLVVPLSVMTVVTPVPCSPGRHHRRLLARASLDVPSPA
jgi:hypothetical protein